MSDSKRILVIHPDEYRDGMEVFVFVVGIPAPILCMLPGKFTLGFTGQFWWLMSEEEMSGNGFYEDEDLGWCRKIADCGTFLSSALVIGCYENVLHPRCAQERGFRETKNIGGIPKLNIVAGMPPGSKGGMENKWIH